MVGRLFWFGVAAAAGIVVYRKLTRTAESYSPRGLAASAGESAVGLVDSVREFMVDVRDGMAEREEQIHAALAENAEFGDLSADDLDGPDDDRPHDPMHPYHQEGEPDR